MRPLLAGLLLLCAIAGATVPNDDVPGRINSGYSFAPIVGYDPLFGFLFGGAAFRGSTAPPYSNGNLQLYMSTKKHLAFSVTDKFWDRERRFYSYDVGVNSFSDVYFGEGDRTSVASRLDIDSFRAVFTPLIGYRIDERWTLQHFATVRYRDETGTRYFGSELRPIVGVSLTYDSRDNQIDTRRGRYVLLTVNGGLGALSTRPGREDFAQAQVEWREFLPAADWLVLAAQGRFGASAGDAGYLFRYSLGGHDSFRGYPNNRFRGATYYLGQLEARLRISKWVHFALFAALADISDRNTQDFHGPRFAKGAGIRLNLPPDFVAKARLDFGFGDDQSSIYLNFNEAF